VVGEAAAIQNVEKVLGNAIKSLKEPNLVAVFIGIILGLALGAIPISLPGISAPVKLGLAGGPIIVGILIGTFGPRMHMITYTTRSANLMLRALGLSLYLACLGLDAGAHFFDTVFRPEGLLWIATGFALTVVPVLILLAGLVALFNPTGVRSTAFIIIGISSLVYAASELLNWFKFTRRRPKAPGTKDSSSREINNIEDAEIVE